MKILTVSLAEGDARSVKFELSTSASAEEVWEAIKGLRAEQPEPVVRSGRKYGNVSLYFRNSEEHRMELSFSGFAQVLGSELPQSAYDHRAWWANDPKHSQARAWMAAGWRVLEVKMTEEKVVFGKAQTA